MPRHRVTSLSAMVLCAAVAVSCGAAGEIGPDTGPRATRSSTPTSPTTSRAAGPWIAFQAPAAAGDGIFLVGQDGEGEQQIVADVPGEAIHPSWSPDGSMLAFVVSTADSGEIWVADADGEAPHVVTKCRGACLFYDYVAWVPGRPDQLLAVRDDGPTLTGTPIPGSSVLELLDTHTGKGHDVVTSARGQLFSAVSVSPDGRRYCAGVEIGDKDHGVTGSALVVGAIAGGDPRMVTDPREYAAYCDWHPDGDQLVYTTHDLNAFSDMTVASNLYLIAPDGSDRRELTDFEVGDKRATQPRWTPDGRRILFTLVQGDGTTRDMATVSPTGDDLRWATGPEPRFGTHPVLQPVP